MERQELTQTREREKILYRYSCALERGDFDTIVAILKRAENDALLERMIVEWNAAYALEQQIAIDAQDVALVRELLAKHLPSGILDESEAELPRPTVSDVIARMSSDAALKKQLECEAQPAISQLQQSNTPLPRNLTQRGVREIFVTLGVSVSQSFEKFFRETAIFLSMGHEQGRARLAATRRQRQKRRGDSTNRPGSSHEESL